MREADLHHAIAAVWRVESPAVIAALMRMVRDLDLAEALAHDALVTALERWPDSGLPDNPGAWLMATARHRAIDHLRRQQLRLRKHAQIAQELEGLHDELHAAREDALDDDIGDDLLRLIFVACHPLLSSEARVALTLRLLWADHRRDRARVRPKSRSPALQEGPISLSGRRTFTRPPAARAAARRRARCGRPQSR